MRAIAAATSPDDDIVTILFAYRPRAYRPLTVQIEAAQWLFTLAVLGVGFGG